MKPSSQKQRLGLIKLKLNLILGGAFSQAKGAFSSWWSNFMVNPEQGQKIPETATEAHAPTLLPEAENDIPNNHECSAVVHNEAACNGDKTPEILRQAGEVHTV